MKKSLISGVSKSLHEQALQASYMTLNFTPESLCNCLVSFGVSGNVVLRLTQNLNAASNFKVFFDNWFSSVALVECLKQKKMWSVGTIRLNRLKSCKMLTDQELKKGRGACDFKVDQEHGVIIVK